MPGAPKCAAAVGLITQVIWAWDACSRAWGGANGEIQDDLLISVVTG